MILQVYTEDRKFIGSTDLTGAIFYVDNKSLKNLRVIDVPVKHAGKPARFDLVDLAGTSIIRKGRLQISDLYVTPEMRIHLMSGDIEITLIAWEAEDNGL